MTQTRRRPGAVILVLSCVILALLIALCIARCSMGPLSRTPATALASLSADSAQVVSPTNDSEWADRGARVLTAQQALAALEHVPEDSPAVISWSDGGSREGWFGPAWEDVDGNGCDTRNDILSRDLRNTDYSRQPGQQQRDEGRGQGASVCPDATVWSGVLDDPYTGATVPFQRGADTSAAVQIDHVVPLNYLYAHGAWAWDERTRLLVANDPLNLLAVDGNANHAKGACGPATCPIGSTETGTWQPTAGSGWWPDNDAFRCHYAARFTSVVVAYHLGLPAADHRSLSQALQLCVQGKTPGQGLGYAVWWREAGVWVLGGLGLALLSGGTYLRRRRSFRRRLR